MTETAAARATRASRTNFYYAFRVLPAPRREAIYALYSFCRVVDDCVDEADGEGAAGLDRWMAEVDRCFAGRPQTPIGADLARSLQRYPIPRQCLADIVAGCRMDLTVRRYPTWADLRLYCERVASAVGLASIEIFGYTDPRTREYARELGVALQLTNILRDVGADAARDRVYVPAEELAQHGLTEADLLAAVPAARAPAPLVPVLHGVARRAEAAYAEAARLLPAADRRSMASAEIMAAIYRAVLDAVIARGYPLGGARVGLSRPRKAWLALRTLVRGRAA